MNSTARRNPSSLKDGRVSGQGSPEVTWKRVTKALSNTSKLSGATLLKSDTATTASANHRQPSFSYRYVMNIVSEYLSNFLLLVMVRRQQWHVMPRDPGSKPTILSSVSEQVANNCNRISLMKIPFDSFP